MEKNKYQRMNKEEKKKVADNYYNTKKGKELHIRLKRIFLVSIFCFSYSIYLLIDAYNNNGNIWAYSYAILILISGLVFLIYYYKIKNKVLNKQALKSQRK